MEFIGLLIDRINDELVVLNNSLTDRELTTDFYLREYDLLFNKIILMKLNINNGIVITINDINYVIKEKFNGNKNLSDSVKKMILSEINRTF